MDYNKIYNRIVNACESLEEIKDTQAKDSIDNLIVSIFEAMPGILTVRDNYEAMNLGMWTALYGLEKSTITALNNKAASIQQDVGGRNIGMYAAYAKMENATLIALNNEFASQQRGPKGLTIREIAKLQGIKKVIEQDNKENLNENM